MNTLQKDQSIKKFLAALLLLVFAISATPKIYLHNLFANHKDSTATATESGKLQKENITRSTIHCPCDDLVVEAPFISFYQHNEALHLTFHFVKFSETSKSFVSSTLLSFGLRGPPAVA